MLSINTNEIETVADLLAVIGGVSHDTPVEFRKKAVTGGLCWCGCGQTTKSRFVPGHDSRFHGLAKKVARGEAEWPSSWENEEARADFLSWVQRERPLHEAREAARDAVKAERDAAKQARDAAKTEKVAAKARIVEMVEIDEETAGLLAEMDADAVA